MPKIRIGLSTLIFFSALLFGGASFLAFIPFFAAILHEAGHLFAIRLCGQRVVSLTVLPFGLDIKKAPALTSYKTDIFISSAGILANFAVICLCLPFEYSETVAFFMASNLLLALVNLLPITSLDGGQLLEKTISLFLTQDLAYRISRGVSFCFLLLLFALAIWVLFRSGYNFSLLLMCIYLFLGIFLK